MNQYQMKKPYDHQMEDFSVDSFSSDSYTETPSFIDQSFQTHNYCLQEPSNIKQPVNKKQLLMLQTLSLYLLVQDHVLAERKRRAKLAQRFISLSSLLPELKKMDKATVLEDAANYIQELQNHVKELERKKMQESVEESSGVCDPEIEVRTSGSSLLVEIYSQKNCISLLKVLRETQELGLSIISCSTMPFAETTLLVTIVTQVYIDIVVYSSS
ncbi:hypothetical protein L1987_74822 [Smallanthus sonchifolius]|uniref:Uncharacterized protein n=1 Tax=Smallanthus sonchifolius TaxID=185202 RepID=A0ACB9A391_9ASTR|nr:hypothetical protein L1987_74822 [Smallanthus sonchifolius]